MENRSNQRIGGELYVVGKERKILSLPHFSCHSLRHTFTTRMCEAGVNVKVIQDALGHQDISTTIGKLTPYWVPFLW